MKRRSLNPLSRSSKLAAEAPSRAQYGSIAQYGLRIALEDGQQLLGEQDATYDRPFRPLIHADDVVAATVHGNGPEKVAGLRVRQVEELILPRYEVQPALCHLTVIRSSERLAWLTVSSYFTLGWLSRTWRFC